MTTTVSSALPLTFTRTVDRELLHRSALSEVFLTDCVSDGPGAYLAGAQLPSSHAYWTDHPGHLAVDPVLLLECVRQAETYGGHVELGIRRDTKFVLRSWSLKLPGLFDAPAAGRPADVQLSVSTDLPRGPIRALSYHVDISVAGVPVGSAQLQVGYLTPGAYDLTRARSRTSRPPMSDQVVTRPSSTSPWQVGRGRTDNVVLTDAVVAPDAASAWVRPVTTNPSMFDHAVDHVPGMVLTEAARQLCLLIAAERGIPASATTVVGLDLSFSRFAELDAPVIVSAVPLAEDTWSVTFHQYGDPITEGTVTTAAVPAALRTDRSTA